jgi:hypothetical protein
MAGRMALLSLGVMRMVRAPAAIMFSMAVTWPALSPSVLPAPLSSLAPLGLGGGAAPSFIFTKKGLVSVLVMRPITGSPAASAAPLASSRAAAPQATAVKVVLNMSVSWVRWGGENRRSAKSVAARARALAWTNSAPAYLITQVD